MEENHEEEEITDVEERHATAGNLMDSKTSHLDDLLSEKLENAFHKTTLAIRLHDVAKIASEHQPIDLAYAAARLPHTARPVLFENLPSLDAQIDFLTNTDGKTRSLVLRELSDHQTQELLEIMPADEAVWLVDNMSDRKFRRIVEKMDPEKVAHIRELQQHDRNTAGRLMTNEFFAFTMDHTIGEVSQYIRHNPGIDFTRRIFVLSEEGELLGYVPARTLIVNPPDIPLRHVMREILHKVTPDATREEAVDLVERYKISALPVVDAEDRMVGVITYEDAVEIIEDLADETIARMAGTTEEVSAHGTIAQRYFSRAPWLLFTVMSGLVASLAMSYFENREGLLFTYIIFFVPLITGISGNVGIQCSTVLVRSMAIGALSSGERSAAIVKEITTGVTVGLTFGALAGFAVYALTAYGILSIEGIPAELGVMVGAGLFGASFVASLLGSFSPFIFSRIGADPAVASGPITTAINDVIAMGIFFIVATLTSSFFFTP